MSLQRHTDFNDFALTASLATTKEIPFGSYAAGKIHIPAGSSITSLTFYGAPVKEGTFLPTYDSTNAAVTRTVAAGRCYPIPDECFGDAAIKIVADASGTVNICFKS